MLSGVKAEALLPEERQARRAIMGALCEPSDSYGWVSLGSLMREARVNYGVNCNADISLALGAYIRLGIVKERWNAGSVHEYALV